MAINMLRFKPKNFITHVQRVLQKRLIDSSQAHLASQIIESLKALAAMRTLKFNDAANSAVRANNEDICQKDEAEPAEGGNLAKL